MCKDSTSTMRGNSPSSCDPYSEHVKKMDLDIDAIQNCEYLDTENFLDEPKN